MAGANETQTGSAAQIALLSQFFFKDFPFAPKRGGESGALIYANESFSMSTYKHQPTHSGWHFTCHFTFFLRCAFMLRRREGEENDERLARTNYDDIMCFALAFDEFSLAFCLFEWSIISAVLVSLLS